MLIKRGLNIQVSTPSLPLARGRECPPGDPGVRRGYIEWRREGVRYIKRQKHDVKRFIIEKSVRLSF